MKGVEHLQKFLEVTVVNIHKTKGKVPKGRRVWIMKNLMKQRAEMLEKAKDLDARLRHCLENDKMTARVREAFDKVCYDFSLVYVLEENKKKVGPYYTGIFKSECIDEIEKSKTKAKIKRYEKYISLADEIDKINGEAKKLFEKIIAKEKEMLGERQEEINDLEREISRKSMEWYDAQFDYDRRRDLNREIKELEKERDAIIQGIYDGLYQVEVEEVEVEAADGEPVEEQKEETVETLEVDGQDKAEEVEDNKLKVEFEEITGQTEPDEGMWGVFIDYKENKQKSEELREQIDGVNELRSKMLTCIANKFNYIANGTRVCLKNWNTGEVLEKFNAKLAYMSKKIDEESKKAQEILNVDGVTDTIYEDYLKLLKELKTSVGKVKSKIRQKDEGVGKYSEEDESDNIYSPPIQRCKPLGDLEGYEKYGKEYSIYPDGTIISEKTGKKLHTFINDNGYLITQLHHKGAPETVKIHILVAKAFVPNPDMLPVVNHKDTNKQNPNYDNLEWTTYRQNITHAIENGCWSITKKVNQICEETGEVIRTFESTSHAARFFKVSNGVIDRICRGNKSKILNTCLTYG